MGDDKTVVRVNTAGPIWLVGWLFTIGYVPLGSWKILWAIVLWPYYLGAALGK